MEKILNTDEFLTANLKINVSTDRGDFRGVFDSRVEEVKKKSLYIMIPTDKGIPMPLRPGLQVEVSFIAAGGRFVFKSKVVNRVMQNIPMLEIERPEYLLRSELREFFRVDTHLRVKLVSFDNTNLTEFGMPTKVVTDATCLDISGGGARVVSAAQVQMGDKVQVDFENSALGIGLMDGKVKRVRKVENELNNFDIGIVFTNMRDSDRDKIIKYVFKRQIELRKLLKG